MKADRILIVVFFSLLFCSNIVEAQKLLPLNNTYQYLYQDFYYFSGDWKKSNIKPIMQINDLPADTCDIVVCEVAIGHSYLNRKLFKENFIKVEKDDYKISIDPLFNFSLGSSNKEDFYLYNNIRGIQLEIDIAKKVSIHSDIYEAQSAFPLYINASIDSSGVINGSINPKNFKENGRDYASSSAYISINPNYFLNIQAGSSKHFFGDGYRSLFLSDNAFQYPFIKFDYNRNDYRYIWMITAMQNPNFNNINQQNIPQSNWGSYQKKASSFFYFSKVFCERFRIGLFESVVWKAADSTNNKLDIEYFNPLIAVNTATKGLSNTDNTSIGIDFTYKLSFYTFLYSQFLVDEIRIAKDSNSSFKYALQLGVKTNNFLISNFDLRFETNIVSPYMYSHKVGTQSYTNYNQSLTHPLGANFMELIGVLHYNIKRFNFTATYMFASQGVDDANKYFGSNIFVSDLLLSDKINTSLLEGKRRNIQHLNLDFSYFMNRSTNLNIFINAGLRKESIEQIELNEFYLMGGIRTSLTNNSFLF